jgi:tetratricopeptide (TPR) repeat protein
MVQRQRCYLSLSLLIGLFASPTLAVLGGDESPHGLANDADYAAGIAAFQRADWQRVLNSMGKVVERRPWDDNAYNLMGFASRKLGDYRRALAYYHQALDLNPHHRGALEYLGEAYLDMGCIAQAHELLTRLEGPCQRLMNAVSSCQEWQELQAAIAAYRGPARPDCALP